MKIKDMRELSDEELEVELQRLHKAGFDLRAQSVTEKLEDPTLLTKTRKDIARILTIRKERQIAKAGK
ncbi:MAG: 50S ribosomal protein L29 [Planctomycetes bacterium]|jgi:large subunit ribosomal protein L29|nr:50S ribosomal protein L29 [Planctomycetota bacterium]